MSFKLSNDIAEAAWTLPSPLALSYQTFPVISCWTDSFSKGSGGFRLQTAIRASTDLEAAGVANGRNLSIGCRDSKHPSLINKHNTAAIAWIVTVAAADNCYNNGS